MSNTFYIERVSEGSSFIKKNQNRANQMTASEKRQLAHLVREKEQIWNLAHPRNKDVTAHEEAWQEISAKMDKPKEICKVSWKSLKDCFRYRIKVAEKLRKQGEIESSTKNYIEANWEFAKDLAFLAESGNFQGEEAVASSSDETEMGESKQNFNKKKCGQTPLRYEIIESKRRDKYVLHSIDESQLYKKNKILSDGTVAYTCVEKTCKARIYIGSAGAYYSEPFSGHHHLSKEKEILDMKLVSKMKADCDERLQPRQRYITYIDDQEVDNGNEEQDDNSQSTSSFTVKAELDPINIDKQNNESKKRRIPQTEQAFDNNDADVSTEFLIENDYEAPAKKNTQSSDLVYQLGKLVQAQTEFMREFKDSGTGKLNYKYELIAVDALLQQLPKNLAKKTLVEMQNYVLKKVNEHQRNHSDSD